ncbi:hypothetical protein ACVWXL_007044 [Bradyrhizobium sp. GM22.5]
MHWEYRDSELRRFRNELEKQGRPVCILVVTGPVRELAYFDTSTFKLISALNHALDQEEARDLGRHLNKFLRVYGKPRPEWHWDKFYQEHTVRHLEGIAAFWVTLSFWLQWQSAPEVASENCVEALGILFSAIHSNEEDYRRPQLTELADQALELLLKQAPGIIQAAEPKSTLDVLIKAWLDASA